MSSVRTRPQFLLISLSNIGDAVLTTPVVAMIKQTYPDSFLKVVVGPKAQALFQGSSMVDELIVYDKHASWFEKKKFIFRLRRQKYEGVVDLRNTVIPFLLSSKKRSPVFRRYLGGGMRKKHLDIFFRSGFMFQESELMFDFFSGAEKKNAFAKMSMQNKSNEKYIVLSAGSASDAKRWPIEKYKGLAVNILNKTDHNIVLIGDQRERPYVQILCEVNPDRVNNAAGILSLREAAAVIDNSELLVTNDSAAMHIGHELSKNVVAIFGPSDAEKYGRRGPFFKLLKSNPTPEQKYFDDILIEDVESCVHDLLHQDAFQVKK